MAALTTLELNEWTEWDSDLSPLSRLTALRQLTCSTVCMLADILTSGGLDTVTTVRLRPLTFSMHDEKWYRRSWLAERDLTEDGFFTALSDALIRMPSLESLTWHGGKYWPHNVGGRVLNDIVAVSPQHWLNTARHSGDAHFTRFRE